MYMEKVVTNPAVAAGVKTVNVTPD